MSRRSNFDDFGLEIEDRSKDLQVMLPKHVNIARFKAVAIAAVKETPTLLTATPRTLFASLTHAAQDGLLPDGREGTIQVYNTKVKVGKEFKWEKQAVWMPMIYGLRKRARELEGMIVSAEIVYRNDHFLLVLGDDPRLDHTPTQLGEPAGDPIGTYAIFRDHKQRILHRELMDTEQIMAVRKKSRNPDGMLWTAFWTQAWRKTVARRGFKTIPVGEELERLVRRDDDHFTFEGEAAVEERPALPPVVRTARPPRTNGQASAEPEAPPPEQPEDADQGAEGPGDQPPPDPDWMAGYEAASRGQE